MGCPCYPTGDHQIVPGSQEFDAIADFERPGEYVGHCIAGGEFEALVGMAIQDLTEFTTGHAGDCHQVLMIARIEVATK